MIATAASAVSEAWPSDFSKSSHQVLLDVVSFKVGGIPASLEVMQCQPRINAPYAVSLGVLLEDFITFLGYAQVNGHGFIILRVDIEFRNASSLVTRPRR